MRQRHVQGEGEGGAARRHQREVPDDPGGGEVWGEPESTGETLDVSAKWKEDVLTKKDPKGTDAMVISEELLCSRLKGRHCNTSNPNP